ncbi:DUF7507 domain-containing protein [Xylanimonas allomyrinae]|nr:DUF11 domain-containing protein [Xylanimonas allomyrinae]
MAVALLPLAAAAVGAPSGVLTAAYAVDTPSAAGTGLSPGSPAEPVLVWSEDFQRPSSIPSAAVPIDEYVGAGADGALHYTADPFFSADANLCNGWVLSAATLSPTKDNPVADTGCTSEGGRDYNDGSGKKVDFQNGQMRSSWYFLRYLAYVLGRYGTGAGAVDPVSNGVLAMETNGKYDGEPSGPTMLSTAKTLSGTAGHYYVVGADVAAMHPASADQSRTDPEYHMYLVVDGDPMEVTSPEGVDPFTDPTVTLVPVDLLKDPLAIDRPAAVNDNADTSGPGSRNPANLQAYVSPVAVVSIPATTAYQVGTKDQSNVELGFQLTNNSLATIGNDGAIDNPVIKDVTPRLDKSFSPNSVVAGEATTLTFTVTNTSDLLAKAGWTFTDSLPDGLVVDLDQGEITTSGGEHVSVVADGGRITVEGDLKSGEKAVTVTVPVRATAKGTYTNDADNVTTWGLYEPGSTTLDDAVPAPGVSIDKTVDAQTVRADEPFTYSVTVKNSGNVAAASDDVLIADPMPLTDVACTAGDGTPLTHTVDGVGTDAQRYAVAYAAGIGHTLAPGESVTCTGKRTLTGDEAAAIGDGGVLTNTASTSVEFTWHDYDGKEVVSPPLTASDSADVAVDFGPDPAIGLEKSTTVANVTEAGQEIPYTFVVTNKGNITLRDVTVEDAMLPAPPDAGAPVCPKTDLAPGESMTCTGTYTTTQADVEKVSSGGSVVNTATATGTGTWTENTADGPRPHDESVSATDTATVPGLPMLTKDFAPETALTGTSVPLTFTMSNGDALAAGTYEFTDHLPDGLTVDTSFVPTVNGREAGYGGSAVTTVNGGAVRIAVADSGRQITVTGSFAAGEAEQIVLVHVIGETAGRYVNGPENVDVDGILEPNEDAVVLKAFELNKVDSAGHPLDGAGFALVTGDPETVVPLTNKVDDQGRRFLASSPRRASSREPTG